MISAVFAFLEKSRQGGNEIIERFETYPPSARQVLEAAFEATGTRIAFAGKLQNEGFFGWQLRRRSAPRRATRLHGCDPPKVDLYRVGRCES